MRNFNKQKKTRTVFLTFSVIAFCVFSFLFLPITSLSTFASSDANDDFDAFDSAYTQMIEKYDTLGETKTYSLEDEDYKIENDELYIKATAVDNFDLSVNEETEVADENGYYSANLLAQYNYISVEENNDGVILEKYDDINRLIVYSSNDVSSYGAVAKAEYDQCHIFQYDDAESAALAFEYYSNLDCVTDVFYDCIISADGSVDANTSYTYKSWGAEYVGYSDYTSTMLEMYDENNLENIVVAVLDSGIYTSHELFQGRLLTEYAKSYITDEDTTYSYQDKNGHGTHVSGTIAEATLSNVKIIPIKVLNIEGKGYVSGIISGINYVIDLVENEGVNIKAMNMSVGVEGSTSSNPRLTSAIKNAYNKGIASIVSAGNGDEKTGIRIDVADYCPANVEEAITVAALVRKKSFPNGYTLSYDTYSNYGQYIDFAAPGTSITSASINSPTAYIPMSGTSMAAPHVTASVALLYSNPQYSNLTIDELYDLLKNNAVDLGSTGWDKDYGWGLINIADIGVVTEGEVTFSSEEKFPTSSFQLSLSYQSEAEGTVKIYYTTDESADYADSSDEIYNAPISISKTTKVTAIAYVYNSSGMMVQRSNVTSFTYYFDNIDLLSNYEYDSYFNGVVLTRYSGELTTLNVPETINSRKVIGIYQYAFKNSNIEVLNLPSSVYIFYDSAFYGCTTLREIHCASSSSVQIGNYAFRDCSNLSVFDVSNVVSVGQYAFASCSSLTSLEIPYCTTIGIHALTKSGIQTLLVGSDLITFSNQTNLSLAHIYGYSGTAAETFALNNNIEFTDLRLSIVKDFSNRIIIKENSNLDLQISYIGLDVLNVISFSGANNKLSSTEESVTDYQTNLNITLSNLSAGEYTLAVTLTDRLSNSLKTDTIYIEVVSDTSNTFTVNFEKGNFDVMIDGEVVEPSTLFFAGFEYKIEIVAHDGYNLRKIVINGEEKSINKPFNMTVNSDLNIEVQTSEKSKLSVLFNTNGCGSVMIEDDLVSNTVVDRNESISFRVEENEGYRVKRVVANNVLLVADADGVYHIDNIIADVYVDITFEEAYYTVAVSFGKGGSMSSSGGDIDNVAHGSSRTFIITPSEGYEIDFVSVNGETISLVGNKFTLDNIDENYDIVVSFKKAGSTFTNDSVVLTYFFIILGIFIVFIVARVVLHFAKKEKK